jgi:CBS domain-containing protein
VGVKETAELEPKVESEKKVEVEGERETTAAAEETTKVKTGEETESQDKVKSEVKKKVDTEGESADEDEVKEPSEDKFDKKIEVEAEEKAEAKEIGTLTEEKAEKIGEPEGNEEERPISKAIQEMTKSVVSVGNGGDVLAMCAKDIMRKDVVWGTPDDSVEESFKKMQQCDIGYILVGQDGIPEGIVSKSDITGAISPYLRPMFSRWRRPLDDATLQIRIKWIMSRPVYTVRPDTPISVIMESVCRYSQRGLPVVDEEGRVQGLITVFDIFRALIGEKAGVSSESRPS